MDDKGFIFTTDATLALVIVIVFTASLITYQLLPVYIGQDHQHLEALADSALNVMEQDGTLRAAAVYYENGNSIAAQNLITESLNGLLPPDITYRMTVGGNAAVPDPRIGRSTASIDIVTKVKVISGPKEGWVGRAYYKLEEVIFDQQQQNVTTTAWNFHNWLTNYSPWSGSNHLQTYPYWGSGSAASPIAFSIPSTATVTGGTFMIGSNNGQDVLTPRRPSYGANFVVNGLSHIVANTSFTFLNNRLNGAGTAITGATMYNYQGNLTAAELHPGANNLYLNYRNNVAGSLNSYNDMPWFALLSKYTTTIEVPQGIISDTDNFTDTAGVAIPTALNLNGSGNSYGFTYNIQNQQKTYFTTKRQVAYGTFFGQDSPTYSDGTPFDLTGIPYGYSYACAVSKITDIDVPLGARMFDSYVVLNAYGAVDGAVVEVWNSETGWQTAFNSNDASGISDGYGNTPGIIYIKDYLRNGNNKVRVTVYDFAPSSDYDFVGIINSYAVTTYSKLPVKWDTFPFTSHQSTGQTEVQTEPFTIGSDAQKALLFVGAGTNSRHIKVEFSTGQVLYDSDIIPFNLDIGDLDAAGSHIMTNGVPGNYTLKPGTYNLKVTVTAPNNAWEAGDSTEGNSRGKAIIFSGMRIGILYPKYLRNVWTDGYANSAIVAQNDAKQKLINYFVSSNITYNASLIKTEAMYTGDVPNAIPVRLDLWK